MGGTDYIWAGLAAAFDLLVSGEPETYSAMLVTLQASTASMLASLVIGMPLGFCLGRYSFPGRRTVRTMVDTLLALPTVVIGLLVYAFLTRHGPLGHMGLLFSVTAMAIGQTVLALPIVASLTATAVESLDQRLKPTLLSFGASAGQAALTTLWEARHALLAAAVTAYGRVVSEVGISMMVGGNIKWHTRSITTSIALETGKGEFARGIALGMVLMLVALAVNFSMSRLRRRE